MPQRFLRPGITNSQRWNSVDAMAGNLFIRLLTLVDDFGRTDGRTSVIFGQCFAVWNELHPTGAVKLHQVAGMLQQLAGVELVDIYEVEGKRVLQISQWQERIREGCKPKWAEKTELAASCSELLPSSPSSPSAPAPAIKRHSSNGSRANTSEPTDQDWLGELSKSEAYQGIDVLREFAKLVEWCKTRKKQPTRRRFVNWLNRCERPVRVPSMARINPAEVVLPSEFRDWANSVYPKQEEDIKRMKTWADVPTWMREEWKKKKIAPILALGK